MKGLEISEVRLKDIDLGDRIDAEYFSKQDLAMATALKKCGSEELRNFGEFVASAFYPAATELYNIGDVPFMRCVDCISYPVITHQQDDLFERIPADFVVGNKGVSTLNRGEIVITKVGTPCYASIVHEHESVALFRTVMGIANIKGIDPYYLLAFFRSKYGFLQLMRQRELTIQYQLTLERVKRILVYNPTEAFQAKVRGVVEQFIACERKAVLQYREAEQMLLAELGFAEWSPTDGAVSVKSYSDFVSAGRFDAEYFQPKYDDYETQINSYKGGCDSLKAFVRQNTTLCNRDLSDYQYVEIGDVNVGNAEYSANRILTENLPANAKIMAKKGDVIISKVRPNRGAVAIIGTAADDLVVSGAFTVVSATDDLCKEVLLVLLRTWVYRDWFLKWTVGSSYPVLKDEDVLSIPVPLVDKKVQRAIADKVQTSFALRAESKRLLDLAKHAVELAIEQGEEKAMEAVR